MPIKYIVGNLFDHLPGSTKTNVFSRDDNFLIPHIANNIGVWSRGFVVPLSIAFPKAEQEYRKQHKTHNLRLGGTQVIKVSDVGFVANMVAQNGIKTPTNPTPIKYDALQSCMNTIADKIREIGYCQIIAPKFGSLRAGGDWGRIEKMIEETWSEFPVTIFEYEEK